MGWARDHEWEANVRLTLGDDWHGEAPKAYRMGALRALVSRDDVGTNGMPDLRWHISLGRLDRVPTWDELAKAAHHLRPGVMFCVPLPPKSMWINVHKNTLHLMETKDMALVEQWRHEGQVGHEQTAGKDYR